MTSNVKKGQAQREKTSRNYETGTIFLIKLLTGFAIYVTLRILLSYVLMHRYGMTRLWTRPLVEEATLIFSACVIGLSPWLKQHRLNLIASAWIYALTGISFVLWFTYLLNLGHRQGVDATLGVLPVVVPYTIFITLYLFKADSLKKKIIVSGISLLLLIMWSIDIPQTYQHTMALQESLEKQEIWTNDFMDQHKAGELPEILNNKLEYGIVTLPLIADHYMMSDSSMQFRQLDLVQEIYLQMNGSDSDLKLSEQELLLNELEKVHYHYLYKHFTTRRVVFRDFEFDGKLIYKAEDTEGNSYFLDNLSVVKRSFREHDEN